MVPVVGIVGFADGIGVAVIVGVEWLRVGEGMGVGVAVGACVPVHPVMSMMNDKIAIAANNCFIMLVDVWRINLIIYRWSIQIYALF
jgi:hypothetical protein